MIFFHKINEVQQQLREEGLDGWLLYDFRRNNDLAIAFLNISDVLLTRRFAYCIPSEGEPVKIVHKIEPHVLDSWPGKVLSYASWQEFEGCMAQALQGMKRVAMEFSPLNAIPYVSKVDAGTVDLVRSYGVEVVSSGDLLQRYTAVWDQAQWQSHLRAAALLERTVEGVWHLLADALLQGREVKEYDVQQYMLKQFELHKCLTDSPPICAVNAHAADPHYSPDSHQSSLIRRGDFVLIDLWCKENLPYAPYADITRVAVAAECPTLRQQEIFSVVRKAQKQATDLVIKRFQNRKPVMGWEVDQACRQVIIDAGYGEYFIHRTGHNIGLQDHGSGTNIDNLETHDRRHLLAGTCFSIEPGIYLPGEFGVRLEYDVFIHPEGSIEITGGIQEEIVCLCR